MSAVKSVVIRSTKVLKQGDNGRGPWTMRKLELEGADGFDMVTFDDDIPDHGPCTVEAVEQAPYQGRRQFKATLARGEQPAGFQPRTAGGAAAALPASSAPSVDMRQLAQRVLKLEEDVRAIWGFVRPDAPADTTGLPPASSAPPVSSPEGNGGDFASALAGTAQQAEANGVAANDDLPF